MPTRIQAIFSITAFVVALGLVLTPVEAAQDKDLKSTVRQIAEAIRKGDADCAKKMAVAVAKDKELIDRVSDFMHLFGKRKGMGLGVGPKPLENPSKDSIEIMIRDLARMVPPGFTKQLGAFEDMGYHIAALGEVSLAAADLAPIGAGKTKAAWTEMSEDMRHLGIAFAKAVETKNADKIKTAAGKVNENCNRCHTTFKKMP